MAKRKRLIVCADGTWNTPNQSESGVSTHTNVYRTAWTLAPTDDKGVHQVVCYLQGVGTRGRLDKLKGGALGRGLDENIESAYRFLVQNHDGDDELCLFGFSRGAYTVRSLAGLIRNCGLLPKKHDNVTGEAMNLYRLRGSSSAPEGGRAKAFRKKYESREVRIRFIGVWDTVGALGIPVLRGNRLIGSLNRRYAFHDVRLSRTVDYAYHALAIDERRAAYAPTVWDQQPSAGNQVLEQRWFAGAHSDVGGGYARPELSHITFQWMMQKAEACGLAYDDDALKRLGVDKRNYRRGKGRVHNSRSGAWKATRSEPRRIEDAPEHHEAIHISAKRRHRNHRYRPKTLTDALSRGVAVVDD